MSHAYKRPAVAPNDALHLSANDWNMVLKLIDAPPAPNARLEAALRHYRSALRPAQANGVTQLEWSPATPLV